MKRNHILTISIFVVTAILIVCGFEIINSAHDGAELTNPAWNEFGSGIFKIGIASGIGGILKLLIEQHQTNSKNASIREKISNDIKIKVSDIIQSIENQKILITTHKSALTYGKAIREVILPVITQLKILLITKENGKVIDYHIDNSGVEEFNGAIKKMIEKLKELVTEYENSYLPYSHRQDYLEKIKYHLATNYAKGNILNPIGTKDTDKVEINSKNLIRNLDKYLSTQTLPVQEFESFDNIFEEKVNFDKINNFIKTNEGEKGNTIVFSKEYKIIADAADKLKWNPIYSTV